MELIPRTGASVIVHHAGNVLLVRRGKEPFMGKWSLPGGAQNAGETLEDTARRELIEETGLTANELIFCTVRDRMAHKPDGGLSHHYVLVTYLATGFSGEALAGDDADDLGWFNSWELGQLDTTPETPELVRDMLARHSIVLS